MYRDVVQWSKIRHRILVKGDSRRQVTRETGISANTIDKMLAHRHPQPYLPRSHRYPRLGPHVASIHRMLEKNAGLPPSARLSVKDIYERVRDEEGFVGGYSTVSDYVRPAARDEDAIFGLLHEPPSNVMVNTFWQDLDFIVQEGAVEDWLKAIDTSRSAPEDISETDHGESLSSVRYKVAARSVVVLMRPRRDKAETQK
jgi:hypothetical protein